MSTQITAYYLILLNQLVPGMLPAWTCRYGGDFFLISPKSKNKLLNQMKGGSLENLKNIIPAKFS
jgi:hypothetical protein